MCVSNDDLLAPYKERELAQYKDLCEVLNRNLGIPLSINEFFSKTEHEGHSLYTINPLDGVQVCDDNQLLVVTCAYGMSESPDNSANMGFTVIPDSVEFRLFAAQDDR